MLISGLPPPLAQAQFFQQGPKLVGTGGTTQEQGWSVSLCRDGNTAIVGGPGVDTSSLGAAWVFTRSGGVWSQQAKLVGTGALNSPFPALQGASVALSDDGNTAVVGGYDDNGGVGAAWVFTRVGQVWTQQGGKLVGTGAAGRGAGQGFSVSLSGDGNTAIVGGPADGFTGTGAAWVFTRSDGVWTQEGDKLVGTGAIIGGAGQGWSVSISDDGNTAIVGGPVDNGSTGAAWVFTRSNGAWTQQGEKLVGTGAVGSAFQGGSVSLSGDANTAIVGGFNDSDVVGAAWVFTRSNGVWTQQGDKLVGTGAIGPFPARQGWSVSLSDDGNTAIVGGLADNSDTGAAWLYTRSNGLWSQQAKLVGTGAIAAQQGASVSLSGDGNTAMLGGPHDNTQVGAAWVFAPFAGTPGTATCLSQSITTLIQEFGGLNAAAVGVGFLNVKALQNSILVFCGG